MVKTNNNILYWLKTLLVHGEFENAPDDFDIFDEIEPSSRKTKKPNVDTATYVDTGTDDKSGIKPPTYAEIPPKPKFENPLLDLAYQFGKEDDHLKLIRDTLWEIHEFEKELDDSFDNLNKKFDKQEYQYDTTSTKIIE